MSGGVPLAQQCPTCHSVFVGPACPTCIDRRAEEKSPAEIPKRFGAFEILEPLGRGGMGAVYKARQASLNRIVALKVLPPEKSRNPEFPARFEREAKALATLSHPHILTVHEFGQEGPFYFIAMELVEGRDLRRLLQERKLSPTEGVAIADQILKALEYAHERGVVHRDIKPENVLIDGQGNVKLADFGLAKIAEAGEHRLTQSTASMGTFHYMAPEQMESSADVDSRADLYSVGVVLFEMLTGGLPVGKFDPPSEARLNSVVLKALEKDPRRRYSSATEFRQELGSSTQAIPPAPSLSLRPLAIVAVLLAGIGAALLLIRPWKKPVVPGAAQPQGLDRLRFDPKDAPGGRELWAITGFPQNPFRAKTANEVEQVSKWIRENRLEAYLPGTLREGIIAIWRGGGFAAMEAHGPLPSGPDSPFSASCRNHWTYRCGDFLVFAFVHEAEERKFFLDLVAWLQAKLGLPAEIPHLSIENILFGKDVRSQGWQERPAFGDLPTPFLGRTPEELGQFLQSLRLPEDLRSDKLQSVYGTAFKIKEFDPAVAVAALEYADPETASRMEALLRQRPRAEKCEILRSERILAIVLLTSESEESLERVTKSMRKRMGL